MKGAGGGHPSTQLGGLGDCCMLPHPGLGWSSISQHFWCWKTFQNYTQSTFVLWILRASSHFKIAFLDGPAQGWHRNIKSDMDAGGRGRGVVGGLAAGRGGGLQIPPYPD